MWHYQLIRRKNQNKEYEYAIHEYYPDLQGKGPACTRSPVSIWGDSEKEVLEILEMIRLDIEKYGVIDYEI